MKGIDSFLGVFEMTSGFPGVVSFGVTLPSDKVLEVFAVVRCITYFDMLLLLSSVWSYVYLFLARVFGAQRKYVTKWACLF